MVIGCFDASYREPILTEAWCRSEGEMKKKERRGMGVRKKKKREAGRGITSKLLIKMESWGKKGTTQVVPTGKVLIIGGNCQGSNGRMKGCERVGTGGKRGKTGILLRSRKKD